MKSCRNDTLDIPRSILFHLSIALQIFANYFQVVLLLFAFLLRLFCCKIFARFTFLLEMKSKTTKRKKDSVDELIRQKYNIKYPNSEGEQNIFVINNENNQ